jgi:opacity protein-like surface antigen
MRAFVLIFALTTPSLVHAQSIAEARSFTATPFLTVTFGPSGETTTSSLGIGGAFAYDATSNLGFEAEFGHIFDIQGDSDSFDWSLTTITGNVVYHFDVLRVTPYATAGLGVQGSGVATADIAPTGSSTTVTSPSDTEIVLNFGGGIKYNIGDRMQARADLRRFQANDSSPDHWRVYAGITFVLRR